MLIDKFQIETFKDTILDIKKFIEILKIMDEKKDVVQMFNKLMYVISNSMG